MIETPLPYTDRDQTAYDLKDALERSREHGYDLSIDRVARIIRETYDGSEVASLIAGLQAYQD